MRLAIIALLMFSGLGLAQPVKRQAPAGSPWTTLPHLADGATWSTTFILTNLTNSPQNYRLDFHGDDGKTLSLDLIGRNQATSFVDGAISAGGSVQFSTTGTRSTLLTGWADLDIDKTGDVGLMAIFRNTVTGRPRFEATVFASSTVDTNSLLPFDNTEGYISSIAILNPNLFSTSDIAIELHDENGGIITSETIRLTAGTKVAFTLPSRWPSSAGKRGTLHFLAGPYYLSSLGFRFDPGGAFSTLAVMDKQ